MRPQSTFALLALAGVAAGCGGGDESQAPFQPPTATVERAATNVGDHPLVRDASAIRRAAEGGTTGEVIRGIYALLRRAAAEDPADGAARIKAQLPTLARQLVAARPADRARIGAARMSTDAGRGLRRVAILTLDRQVASFRALEQDVASRQPIWDAVARWGARNDRIKADYDRRFRAVFGDLPNGVRASLERAVREVYAP